MGLTVEVRHCSWFQYICWLSLVHVRCTINLRQTSEQDVNAAKNSTATACFLLTGPPIAPCCLSCLCHTTISCDGRLLCLTTVCGENVLQIVIYPRNVLKFSPAKLHVLLCTAYYKWCTAFTVCGPRLSACDTWHRSGGM